MSTGLRVLILPLFVIATQASGQVFTIWAEAPEAVNPGETYTVEFWGSIEGPEFIDGFSAMAGFGINAIATEGGSLVVVNHGSVISDWAAGLGTDGTVVGPDLYGTSGGQLSNGIFVNPNINMNNPIVLFTFDVTVGDMAGAVTYTPDGPNVLGGLSFYPDSQDFGYIVAPNDPGTTLLLVGATTRIVPAPATLGVVIAGLCCFGSRRRT